MTANTRKSLWVLAALAAAVFLVTVWPTRYRYEHVNLRGTVLPVRIDRFSGKTEILYEEGWEEAGKAGDRVETLPVEEKAKVTRVGHEPSVPRGQLLEDDFAALAQELEQSLGYRPLGGELHNGSSYYLREVIITVTAREKSGGLRWSRQFKAEVSIDTLTTGPFEIKVTGAEGAALTWSIDEVKGVKRK